MNWTGERRLSHYCWLVASFALKKQSEIEK